MTLDASARELFSIHNAHGPLEKNVGAPTMSSLHARCIHQLKEVKMEGSMMRHVEHVIQLNKRCELPTFLLSFRTKLVLNRLPTRQERNRRGDKHADDSPVAPHCPHCPTETATHEHALVNCPHINTFNLRTLLNEVNSTIRKTISTLYRQGMQDVGRLSAFLAQTTDHPFLLTDGWRTWYMDRHGRKTETGRGPRKFTNVEGRRSLQPYRHTDPFHNF